MKNRDEILDEYKWDLTDIFKSHDLWEVAVNEVYEKSKKFADFKTKLKDPNELSSCLKLKDDLGEKLGLVELYAYLKSDEDKRISENQILVNKADQVRAKYESSISFIAPELLEIGEHLRTLSNEENLKIYSHYFDNILRAKEHTLTSNEENLLAKMGELYPAFSNIYTMINNADMEFEDVEDKDGNKHKLTLGTAGIFAISYDRVLRKNAAVSLMKEYERRINSIGQTFIESLKQDKIISELRNYNSTLEMKLAEDNIPVEVYTNLLETVSENLGPLHKLMKLRKKVLGLDELYTYDNSVPLVKEADIKIDYPEAVENVLESLKILGEDYYQIAKKGFASRWIDVYENTGKRSGAYSWSVPGSHPYILMNYNRTVSDMFTLTHEMGHSVHSYLSQKTQPFLYGDYSIFSAEIASTVNETLLHNYLMKTTKDPKIRAYLLNQRIDRIRSLIFRQVTFAEFEMKAHELAKNGTASLESLNEIFLELSKREYGDDVKFLEYSSKTWTSIPHFYRSFYVLQYATGLVAAIAIVEKIEKKGQPAIDAYLDMLKAGNSDYSLNLLKKAGVDLTTKEPIEAAMRYFSNLVDQLEEELEKIQ